VDFDNDGETDVLLGESMDSLEDRDEPAVTRWFHLVTPPTSPTFDASLIEHVDAGYWIRTAASLDAAFDALTHVPRLPIPRAEACRVIALASDPSHLREAVLPGARVLGFTEPGWPTGPGGLAPFTHALPRRRCGVACVTAGAAFCGAGEALSESDYWFMRDAGRWRIAGMAVYSGS
jgi:hypothetical protein